MSAYAYVQIISLIISFISKTGGRWSNEILSCSNFLWSYLKHLLESICRIVQYFSARKYKYANGIHNIRCESIVCVVWRFSCGHFHTHRQNDDVQQNETKCQPTNETPAKQQQQQQQKFECTNELTQHTFSTHTECTRASRQQRMSERMDCLWKWARIVCQQYPSTAEMSNGLCFCFMTTPKRSK